MAQLRRLRERFPNELVIIGVHSAKFPSERDTQNIAEAAHRLGIEHPVVNDAAFKIWNAYNVNAWPTIVLIDPKGEIAGVQPGEIDAAEFSGFIETMIAEFAGQGSIERGRLLGETGSLSQVQQALKYPAKLIGSGQDRLFVSDTGHNRVLEIRLDENGISGEVVRVFGSGEKGLSDGRADEVKFDHPHGLARVGETLYVADTGNHAIRAIELESGIVRTIAGTGEKGARRIASTDPREIELRSPWDLAALEGAAEGGKTALFIAMAGSHQIWLMLAEERIGIFAGNGHEALVDGSPSEASFNQPSGLSLGMGHLIVADAEASAIRAISLGEEMRVFTLVGQGLFEFGDIDGNGQQVRLQHPAGVAFGDELIWIADSYNHKVKRLDPTTGDVSSVIGTGKPGYMDGPFDTAQLYQPEGLAVIGERLFIADTNNHKLRVANLVTQEIDTVHLRGMEKFKPSHANDPAIERLDAVTVSPGAVEFEFQLVLPDGYKLTKDVSSSVQIAAGNENPAYFDPQGIAVLAASLDQDRELMIDLTIYYCETSQQHLCRIHDRKLILPVRVKEGAPAKVSLRYTLAPEN